MWRDGTDARPGARLITAVLAFAVGMDLKAVLDAIFAGMSGLDLMHCLRA